MIEIAAHIIQSLAIIFILWIISKILDFVGHLYMAVDQILDREVKRLEKERDGKPVGGTRSPFVDKYPIIACRHCHALISNELDQCPHCGNSRLPNAPK